MGKDFLIHKMLLLSAGHLLLLFFLGTFVGNLGHELEVNSATLKEGRNSRNIKHKAVVAVSLRSTFGQWRVDSVLLPCWVRIHVWFTQAALFIYHTSYSNNRPLLSHRSTVDKTKVGFALNISWLIWATCPSYILKPTASPSGLHLHWESLCEKRLTLREQGG